VHIVVVIKVPENRRSVNHRRYKKLNLVISKKKSSHSTSSAFALEIFNPWCTHILLKKDAVADLVLSVILALIRVNGSHSFSMTVTQSPK
jgi:hypothetical protein